MNNNPSLKSRLVQGGMGVGALGIVNYGIGFVIAIALARMLGPEGYGYYSFAGGLVSLMAIPAQLGMPKLLSRQIAFYGAREEWPLMSGIRSWSLRFSLVSSTMVGVLLGSIIILLNDFIPALDRKTFVVALFTLPVCVLLGHAQGCLTGLRFILSAVWPTAILRPLVMLLLLGFTVIGIWQLTPSLAMLFSVAAFSVAAAVTLFMVRSRWPKAAVAADASSEWRVWLRSLIPFGLLAAVGIINQKTDILMLGVFTSAAEVGVYNVVSQAALAVSFPLTALNTVLAPNIAHLHAKGSTVSMQQMLNHSAAVLLVISAVAIAVIALFGRWVLAKLFGNDFVHGYWALVFLCIGQLINAGFGSVGQFLTMSGYERDSLRALAVSAVINVALNLWLIPRYGMAGAAISTTICVLTWNILLSISLYQRLGLTPGPIRVTRSAAMTGR